MKSHFNPFSTANTIMMLRTRFKGAFLLLEGDTDVRLFSNLTDYAKCKLIPTFGKFNAIQTLVELEKRGAMGVLAIVDSDYWILEGVKPGNNLLLTDTHDIETMILLSPALEKTLREFVPGDRMEVIYDIGRSVRQALLKLGLPMGYLRWVSYRERIELNFDSLPYQNFIDENGMLVDVDKMIQIVKVVSKNIPFSNGDFRGKIDTISKSPADPWHVCQGHDLVFLLEIVIPVVLEKFLGKDYAEKIRHSVNAYKLDDNLRLAYESAFFVTTKLYVSVKNWEQANQPYQLLNC